MQEIEENRIAVLDLGTNTFHLLIASVNESSINILFRKTIAVVLGKEGLADNLIHQAAISRANEALSDFKYHMDKYGVTAHRAMATSAIRDAVNGKELINSAFIATGIRIDVITGRTEAELIFCGVKQAVPLMEVSLIMDIGGGSTEFIICDDHAVKWKKSFPIGAARLMEKFMDSDPVSAEDLGRMSAYLKPILTELQGQISLHHPIKLIGSAGSFETFCSLANPYYTSYENWEGAVPEYLNTADKGVLIDLEAFGEVSENLMKSTHQERIQISQIPEVRKDMIIPALIQLNAVMDILKPEELWLSVYSLKEGILYNWIDELKNN